ncbi:unnamed protein product [Ceratitis capitata]|uniref:(Mediterranean fruit fly) hypothetical protein n=1 Tax=Ceratitis capitata TaxID=7213 RepID=A0A811U5P5_CERCA|nr:unnamed protein product [Ceratitis capitata]
MTVNGQLYARLIEVNMQLRYGGCITTATPSTITKTIIAVLNEIMKGNKKNIVKPLFSIFHEFCVCVCLCVLVWAACFCCLRPVKMRAIIILNAIKSPIGRCQ